MKTIINTLLMGCALFCFISLYNEEPTVPTNPDKVIVQGIFDSLGSELIKDETRVPPNVVFETLTSVYAVIVESSNKALGHPIHEIEGMEQFGTSLGQKVEKIVPKADVVLTNGQKDELSKLFLKESKGIK